MIVEARNPVESTTSVSPTTSTTKIEPTTTIPTTIPETTTTSTTLPEVTTTTTLPADITEPTGAIQNIDETIVPLGLISTETNPTNVSAFITGRLLRVYTDTVEDFQSGNLSPDNPLYQGVPKEVVFIDVVLGKYENSDPFIVKFMLGRPEDDITGTHSTSEFITGGGVGDRFLISEYEKIISERNRLFPYSQIKIYFFAEDINDHSKLACMNQETFDANKTGCEWALEGIKHINTNKKIVGLLTAGDPIPNGALSESEYATLIIEITTFPIPLP